MARGELLRKLFSSYSSHDDYSFRATALEIIAEEQQKHNNALAKDLMSVLDNATNFSKSSKRDLTFGSQQTIPFSKDKEFPLVEVRQAKKNFSNLVVSEQTISQLRRVIEEYQKADLLKMHGLRSKNKLLFHGPPGCGKTITAEIIANELNLPILYTRFDSIISSYLGETASNIRQVFEYALSGNWVVLLDEFDAIGKSRSDDLEHGELKRVVNSFLQILDSFDGRSIIIASTNHEDLLDNALWRRFDEIIPFSKPKGSEISDLIRLNLKNFPTGKINVSIIAKKMVGLSHSEIEWICLDAMKSTILNNGNVVTSEMLNESILRQKIRTQRCSTKSNTKIKSRK